jgi:hypothetical protein
VIAHVQKPDFVFRRKSRVHLNRCWASVQSTTGSRGVRISGSNAGYTMFRGSVKGTGYPLHSPVSPSIPLPWVAVCHHISTGVCSTRPQCCLSFTLCTILCLENPKTVTFLDFTYPSICGTTAPSGPWPPPQDASILYMALQPLPALGLPHKTPPLHIWHYSPFRRMASSTKRLYTVD